MNYRAFLLVPIVLAPLIVACSSTVQSTRSMTPCVPPAPNLMVPPRLVRPSLPPASERLASDYEDAYLQLAEEYGQVSLRLLGLQRHIERTTSPATSKAAQQAFENQSNYD